MRGDVVPVCKDGYMHRYEEVWRREHKSQKPSKYGNKELTNVTIRWWVERCDRCGTHRGARPDQKYYALTKVNAQSAIIDNYEQWELDRAAQALADI